MINQIYSVRFDKVLFTIILLYAFSWSVCNAQIKKVNPQFKHPVLNHDISKEDLNRLKRDVVNLMTLNEKDVLDLIPKQTPLIKSACPSCRKDKPYEKKWDGAKGKMMNYYWDYKKPNQIECKDCQTIYPNNEFQMDHSEIFYNMKGGAVEIEYYYDPQKTIYGLPGQIQNKTGRKYYLNGAVDYAKWKWLFPKLESLAKLFHLTKDEKYAGIAVLILKGYSDYFQDYLLTKNYGHTYTTTKNRKMPYGWADTRWDRRLPDESMDELLSVVDLVYESRSMDLLGEELNCDLRDDLWKVFESGLKRRLYNGYNNFFGQTAAGKDYLSLGKVFGKTDLIHLVFQTYFDLPRYSFASDGSYYEGTGYSQIQCLKTATLREDDGYSDPEQYKGADRIENVYPFVGREEFYRKTYNARNDIRYPDGTMVVLQDANPFTKIWNTSGPRQSSINIMKPGYKHLVMGAGKGDEQIQVQLGYGDNSCNHSRQDALGLQMYAFAHPLLSSFPYHKSVLRKFSEMTVTHNSVVVDYKNQNKIGSDADPLFYVPDLPGFSAFSADGARVYNNLTSVYKRTLVLNTVELNQPYLIDIFQVAGGKTHDYIMQSSPFFSESSQSSLKMNPIEGLRPLLPPNEEWNDPVAQRGSVGSGYGLFFDVKQAMAKPYFTIDFTCDNPWPEKSIQVEKTKKIDAHSAKWKPYSFNANSWSDKEAVGTRHHIVGEENQQVFLTKIPALNRNGFYGEMNTPIEKWETMPQFILRSKPEESDSESLFVVVHEPFYNAPKITSVKRIDLNDPNILLLEIECKNRKDLFVYSLNGKSVDVEYKDLEFSGVMGLVAANNTGKIDAYLVGGNVLKSESGKVHLRNETAKYTGVVVGSSRKWDEEQKENSLIVEADLALPTGDIMAGQWIMLNHHGVWDVLDSNSIKQLNLAEGKNSYGIDSKKIYETFYKDIEDDKANPKSELEQMEGGGHCFEISRIEKRNGKTIIHTKNDHGLIIKDGKTKEYFYPCRLYNGTTTFEIYSSIGTQATPVVSPAGGSFLESIEVVCKVPGNTKKILYALTKPSVLPKESDWSEYYKALNITSSTDLHVKSSNSNAIKTPKIFTYSFSGPLEPLATNIQMSSGLIRETYVTENSLKYENQPDFVKTVNDINADDLVQIIGRRSPGKVKFSGFFYVDCPGIYTFYYLADSDGTLKIGDRKLLSSRPNLTASPVARIVKVALKEGFYPINFELNVKGGFSRWNPSVKLEWSGPGIVRGKIPKAKLFHNYPVQ